MLREHMRGRKRAGLALLTAPILLAAPVLLESTAYLDSNDVPVTYAGVAHVDVSIPTQLTVAADQGSKATVNQAQVGQAQDYYKFQHVAVHLTIGQGQDLADEPVTFTADTSKTDAGVICRATTDDNGVASCPNDTKIATTEFSGTPSEFIANFAGVGSLQAAQVTGDLTSVG